jgi:hypothetical protein
MPIPQPNSCEHPWVQAMVMFKGEYVSSYRCLICGTVITQTEDV